MYKLNVFGMLVCQIRMNVMLIMEDANKSVQMLLVATTVRVWPVIYWMKTAQTAQVSKKS